MSHQEVGGGGLGCSEGWAGSVLPWVRGQLEGSARCGRKGSHLSQRTLLATHSHTHTCPRGHTKALWKHKQVDTLVYIQGHPQSPTDTKTHTRDIHQRIHMPFTLKCKSISTSISTHTHTHSDIFTHTPAHNIHRQKGKRTGARTWTPRCTHTDTERDTLRHNHTHSCTPRATPTGTMAAAKTCTPFAHSCTPACTLESKARTYCVPAPVHSGTFRHPHRYTQASTVG